MTSEIINAFFTNDGAGATGLTVTISVTRVAKASGTPALVVNEASMTEDSSISGSYWYRATGIDTENYSYFLRAKTAGTADSQELSGVLWTDTNAIDAAATLNEASLVSSVWSNPSRTLTTALSPTNTLVDTGNVRIVRGDTLAAEITVGDVSGWQEIWVTIKSDTDDADSASILQWQKTVGLLYLNGSGATAGNGSIDVLNADTGQLRLNLVASDADDLVPEAGLSIDCQIIDADSYIRTVSTGTAEVVADVTRVTS